MTAWATDSRGPTTLPPLVAAGEPETLLGVTRNRGVVSFAKAPPARTGFTDVAVAPDGSRLASGDELGSIILFAVDSGRQLVRFRAHDGPIESLAFSGDGRWLASTSRARVVLWDVVVSQERRRFDTDPANWLHAVTFSPDGAVLLAAGNQYAVEWEPSTGKELPRFAALQAHGARGLAFSPDGRWLASMTSDNQLCLFDAKTREQQRCLEPCRAAPPAASLKEAMANSGTAVNVVFSPDGQWVGSDQNGTESTVCLWNAATGRIRWRWQGSSAFLGAASFSDDSRWMAWGNGRGEVRIQQVDSGREIARLTGHLAPVRSVAFLPGARQIVSASNDGTNRHYDIGSADALGILNDGAWPAQAIAAAPKHRLLATGDDGGTIHLWDASTGTERSRFAAHAGTVTSLAFDVEQRVLASSSTDRTIMLWDVASATLLARLVGHSGTVHTVRFAPDGKRLASASDDHTIRLWDTTTTKQSARIEWKGVAAPTAVAWGRTGRSLVVASTEATVVFETIGGLETWRKDGSGTGVAWVASDPNGRHWATPCEGHAVCLWNGETGNLLRRLGNGTEAVTRFGFSADGRVLWTVGYDAPIILWDVTSGRKLETVRGPRDQVLATTMGLDSTQLVTASRDGSLQAWSTRRPGAPLAWSSWAGMDGWVSWQAEPVAAHRVLRNETGALLLQPGTDQGLVSQPPAVCQGGSLLAETKVRKTAGQGRWGEIDVTIRPAQEGRCALWIRLLASAKTPVSFRLPPAYSRLEAGETAVLSIGYVQHQQQEPTPRAAPAFIDLYHAHQTQGPLRLGIELPFQAARVEVRAHRPIWGDGTLRLPLSLSNRGNQATGRQLSVKARFSAPDGHAVDVDAPRLVEEGLPPGSVVERELGVPSSVQKSGRFRVEFTITEGLAAGLAKDSPVVGLVASWTRRSEWLPVPWTFYRVVSTWLGLGTFTAILAGVLLVLRRRSRRQRTANGSLSHWSEHRTWKGAGLDPAR